jgi:hypothetical protein
MTPDQSDNEQVGRDTAVAAVASLTQLSEASVSGVLLLVQQKDNPPEVSQLVPTDRALPVLSDVIHAAAAAYVDCEVIDYEPATTTADGQVMWLRVDDVPLLNAIFEESADLAGTPLFDPATSKLSNLQLAAMRAEAGGTAAVFVQSLRGNQIVAQSRRVGVIVRRGAIDLPPRGQILLFRRDVAAIVVGTVALFRDRAAFQRLFGYLDELRKKADGTFRSVTENLRIAGFEQMALAVSSSPAMLGKMASIQRKLNKYPQYKTALTMPKLVEFIANHPECEVEVAGDGEAAELVFTTTRSTASRFSSCSMTITCAPNSRPWITKPTQRARHSGRCETARTTSECSSARITR